MTVAFLIRLAEPRDAPAIAGVHLASRREAMPWLRELHPDEETYAWVADYVIPHREVWVAEADGRVVGVASLEGDFLEQLYILPGYQGRGIGSALFDKARELQPNGFRFYTFQRNMRARTFYERRGCVAVEFSNGSGNEEGEPDVLYRWTPGENPHPHPLSRRAGRGEHDVERGCHPGSHRDVSTPSPAHGRGPG